MPESDVNRIMDGISEMRSDLVEQIGGIRTDLAIHDTRASGYVERIVSAEERVADALGKVADSTQEIKAVVIEMKNVAAKINGNGTVSFKLDRKTIGWIIGIVVGGAAAIGSGQEVAHRVFHALMGGPAQEQGGSSAHH